jgi:predicted transcriptional regulator
MAQGAELSTPVSEVMSREPATIPSNATVGQAIRVMAEGGYRHLPIVDDSGKPTGVVAVHGIVHYLVDHFPETVYNLPPDPKAAPREREGA